MILLTELVNYTNSFLQVEKYRDYSPNGLQVEGKSTIKKIVSGVTACQALLDAAIQQQADAIIVHHGYFWTGEEAIITGNKRQRIQTLLNNNVSLLAYHLPLDAHLQIGNNAQLAKILNLTVKETRDIDGNANLFFIGELRHPMLANDFADYIEQQLLRKPLHITSNNKIINSIAWCTGGAQRYLSLAINAGVDAYLTGEVSESSFHIAKENGIDFFAAGHHATERYGVQALASHLAQQFDLDHQYIDINNPV